ncbi:hypothetical protein V1515DRAFT_589722 [Lipomyces mesembrius]
MTFIPSNDQLDVVHIHSFLHPGHNSLSFREFECRNDRWRAIIDQVCEKKSRQFRIGPSVSPLEEYKGLTEEGQPFMDSTINIGLLPVNNPTHNLISVAAPNAITLTPSTETASAAAIPTYLSAPAVPQIPVLTAPFDTNPYTTTISVAEWQEFLSRPSTVQIWRRKAVLADIGGESNDISTLSVHRSTKRRKKYEWTQVYVCAHAGAKRDRRDPNKLRRKWNKKSIKCGCKARITAGKVIDTDGVVVRWSWEHCGHEYAYPVAQSLKDVATGDATKPGNMQDISMEVQSFVENIANIRNIEAIANGMMAESYCYGEILIACTLSKGAEILEN